MNEAYLRKWHRRMGIVLALFIFLQAMSGLVLNFESYSLPILVTWANILHLGGAALGTVYRMVLGLGLIGMATSGSLIFYRIWQRLQKSQDK